MSDFCRLCGLVKNLHYLSEIDDLELLLEFKLKTCFNISLTFDKLLPQNVCSECIQCLEKSFVFYQNILNIQDELSENIKRNVKREILDCNIECVVLLEQIPNSLLRRSTRKVERTISKSIQVKKEKKVKVSKNKLSLQKKYKKPPRPIISMEEIYKNELNGIFEKTPKTFDGNEEITNSIIWSKCIWKCNQCDLQFNDITLMEQHHSESHPQLALQYCCFSCPKTSFRKTTIINHVSAHQPTLRYCCIYCSKYHTTFMDLYQHYVQSHPNSNLFLCLYCGLYNENGSSAEIHRQLHFMERNYSCDICGKKFKSVNYTKWHIETKHTDVLAINYTCEICGVAFINKSSFTSHQHVHTKTKLFHCDICDTAYVTFGRLRLHNKIHANIKDQICEVCGMAFIRKMSLKKHLRTHRDIYDYKCEFCDKNYKYHDSLKIHRYTHTGEKPYSCLDDNCSMRFTNWPNFNKHMKANHGRDMSKKKLCRNNNINFRQMQQHQF